MEVKNEAPEIWSISCFDLGCRGVIVPVSFDQLQHMRS